MDINKLGKNIKTLRVNYGEKQIDLALAIGVKQNTISNYERGINNVDIEVLKKIAYRYRVTVEQLINDEIEMDNTEKECLEKNEVREILETAYPLFCNEEVLGDENFSNGYKYSRKIYDALYKGEELMDTWTLICFNSYVDAWEKSHIYEALANLLAMLLMIGSNIVVE